MDTEMPNIAITVKFLQYCNARVDWLFFTSIFFSICFDDGKPIHCYHAGTPNTQYHSILAWMSLFWLLANVRKCLFALVVIPSSVCPSQGVCPVVAGLWEMLDTKHGYFIFFIFYFFQPLFIQHDSYTVSHAKSKFQKAHALLIFRDNITVLW